MLDVILYDWDEHDNIYIEVIIDNQWVDILRVNVRHLEIVEGHSLSKMVARYVRKQYNETGKVVNNSELQDYLDNVELIGLFI